MARSSGASKKEREQTSRTGQMTPALIPINLDGYLVAWRPRGLLVSANSSTGVGACSDAIVGAPMRLPHRAVRA